MIVAALGLAGCSSGGGSLDVDARWQLRCAEEAGGCLTARPARAVDGLDGDPGINASCDIGRASNDRRILNALLESGAGASLELINVIFNEGGGVEATPGCAVRVVDEGVTWSSLRCGPALPSAEQPCQLSTVVIDKGAPGGPTLSTTLVCRDIADVGGAEVRDLVSPDSPSPADMPAPITIVSCDGL
jgi:hypothetical protein